MVVGILRVELHVPAAQSLKDKRSVVKSLQDRMRGRFNVAVAEVEMHELWQRACLGIAAVGNDRRSMNGVLEDVIAWLRVDRTAALIRVEREVY